MHALMLSGFREPPRMPSRVQEVSPALAFSPCDPPSHKLQVAPRHAGRSRLRVLDTPSSSTGHHRISGTWSLKWLDAGTGSRAGQVAQLVHLLSRTVSRLVTDAPLRVQVSSGSPSRLGQPGLPATSPYRVYPPRSGNPQRQPPDVYPPPLIAPGPAGLSCLALSRDVAAGRTRGSRRASRREEITRRSPG